MKTRTTLLLSAFLFLAAGCGRPGNSTRSVIQNKGSDTLVNVAQAWAEEYQNVNPDIVVAVTGGGSGTGIAALINGTVDIANASRQITESESGKIKANGAAPVEHVVGYDALAVFLNNNNPIQEMTFEQLAGIYGEGGKIDHWSDLGIQVPGCPTDEIIRVSRQNNSGTYAYFRETILEDGDFKLGSRDMHGSKDVVDLVSNTACAIGYSGLAYATDEVHMPCVSADEGETCVLPSEETAIDRTYPIARPLFMYTIGEAEGPIKEYLDWVKSDEAQCIIADMGYAPVSSVTCGTSGE